MNSRELLLELKRKIEQGDDIGFGMMSGTQGGIRSLTFRNERGEWEEMVDLVELMRTKMRALGYNWWK